MKYCLLSSGSQGNSAFVCQGDSRVLIDCGITKKRLLERLAPLGVGLEEIDRLLITHGHIDHISGIKAIPEEKWMTSPQVVKDELAPGQYFSPYVPFQVGELTITPLPLSHDANNTVGFLIEGGEESLVYITDTGYIKEKVLKRIADKTYYIFESNHDTKMLFTSKRSPFLIRRIHSNIGHLDNVESATYLSNLIGKDTKEVTLAHLSDECNTPELAVETFKTVMISELGHEPDVLLRCGSIAQEVKGGDWEKDLKSI